MNILTNKTIFEEPSMYLEVYRFWNLVDELNTIDTTDVVPMSNPHDMEQRLRSDEVTRRNNRDALMASAPSQEQGYFLVPKVID